MKLSRRNFIKQSSQISAAALLSGALGMNSVKAYSKGTKNKIANSHPNVLFLMVDQLQTPPEGYNSDEGMAQGLKEILGFRDISENNEYKKYFPGFLRLRKNAVVMRKHYTASAACVPSRTCIMTGQYPVTTNVDQTDGLFKSAQEINWLNPEGIPTIGDWFRAAGYTTHYFGKWHISDPEEPEFLEPWGFSEWESSAPEPHGGPADNSGAFRDIEFADKVIEFLNKKGNQSSDTPWFAVGSLVNPHDCSIYPINWQAPANKGVVPWAPYPPPIQIPEQGQQSRTGGVKYEHTVDLNPDGFPQNNGTLPRTFSETLNEKPGCQKRFCL